MEEKERKLIDKNIREFISLLGSKEPAPGGGSLGFLLISLGAAAILKTIKISQKNFPNQSLSIKNIDYLENFIQEFLQYIDKDAQDYQNAIQHIKTDKEKFTNNLYQSTEFLITTTKKAMDMLKYISEFSHFIKDSVYSDLDCGKYTIVAGMLTLLRTAYANLKYTKGTNREKIKKELDDLKIKLDPLKYTL